MAALKPTTIADAEDCLRSDSLPMGVAGCGVVGFLAASDCVSGKCRSDADAYNEWIARGYRIEDWAPVSSYQPRTTQPS